MEQPLMKPWLRCSMPDGKVFAVPTLVIALHRANDLIAQGADKDDAMRRAYAEMADDDTMLDWASNYMSWADVSANARIVSHDQPDYDAAWQASLKTPGQDVARLEITKDNVLEVPLGYVITDMQSSGASCQMLPFKDINDRVIACVAVFQGALETPRYIAAVKSASDQIDAERQKAAQVGTGVTH